MHEFNDESQDSIFEFTENSKVVLVKGRLRSHVQFWETIRAPKFILNTISRGYIIPFLTTPPRARFNNNKSALSHSDFVVSAITELISSGCIVECSCSLSTVINPLSVAVQSSGKKRLILDLRYPNSFLKKCKIRF